ncbi:Plant self-incompatibility protein S1 family [Euphorbia peplus]|nr:Plant self-incompatibility protein S1 family [Euphorbia peplus]
MRIFLLLIISLILTCTPKFSLASKEQNGIIPPKTTVIIRNELSQGESLTIHCKSKNDDLHKQVIQYNESYQWRFRVDLWDSTHFFCGIITGRGWGIYDIYVAKRDFQWPSRRCPKTCEWKVRKDGVHGFEEFGNEDLFFVWKNKTL